MLPDRMTSALAEALGPIAERDQSARAERQDGIQFLTFADLMAKPKDVPCLVERLLPEDGLAVLWGAPGAGKTFLALDLAHCIATGRAWHERAVVAADVVYVAAEGASGLPARVQAWCDANGVTDPDRMRYLTSRLAVDLPDVRAELLEAIRATGVAPRLLVLDTLSANAPDGFNENDTQHMKAVMSGARWIRDQLHCTVLFVHHPGWHNDRMRGSRDLQGAVDVSLKLEGGPGDGPRTLKIEKARDFPAGEVFPLRLAAFNGSCVIEKREGGADGLTPAERSVLLALGEHREEWPYPAKKWEQASGYKKTQFHEIKKKLVAMQLVSVNGRGQSTLTTAGEDAIGGGAPAVSLLEVLRAA